MDAASASRPDRVSPASRRAGRADLLRWGLALVFAWSGGAKLSSLEVFQQSLGFWGFVPEAWLDPVSRIIPATELLLAGWLASGVARPAALLLAAQLGALFATLHAYLLARGEVVPCACLLNNPLLTARPATHAGMLLLSLAVFAAAGAALLLPVRSGSGRR